MKFTVRTFKFDDGRETSYVRAWPNPMKLPGVIEDIAGFGQILRLIRDYGPFLDLDE